MSRQRSPGKHGRTFGVKPICELLAFPRSSVYEYLKRQQEQIGALKRGKLPIVPDQELLQAIKHDLDTSSFVGEGHRKVWARLRKKMVVGRNRVLKIMRENNLLSPSRVRTRPPSVHTACIATDAPNLMWGTDGSKFYTIEQGWCWIFAVIDHFNSEVLGWHVSKYGDRFEALEPLRQAVKVEYGRYEANIATSLKLRMDNGSVYTSGTFEDELEFLGIEASFTMPYSPESNGIAERYFRTLKEQVIWGSVFQNLQEAQEAISRFTELYNEEWLLQRLSYQSPREAKRRYNFHRTANVNSTDLVSNQLVA
ncbi:MAG: IS3 family transposase [Cyanobacteriota/Melainabacteria group bacterium]|uniref:IS3 family transposase n=1 Tax=Mesotoga prima TaxID=1184387 RepID=UPI001D3295E4|nr:IS3 family transposase [Cyanobacteria bacterium HKST-UBA01]MCB9472138.1 IS3 family transposase [Candidatus Obscuribacterales bacterium]